MKRNEVKQWSDSLPPPNRDEAERSEAMERFPSHPQIAIKWNGVKQWSDSPPPNRDKAERSEAMERFPSPKSR